MDVETNNFYANQRSDSSFILYFSILHLTPLITCDLDSSSILDGYHILFLYNRLYLFYNTLYPIWYNLDNNLLGTTIIWYLWKGIHFIKNPSKNPSLIHLNNKFRSGFTDCIHNQGPICLTIFKNGNLADQSIEIFCIS